MNKPLVTVITPTYNCAKFIEETVESVLSQDYTNIEYIIIDDGSTDNTLALLEKYKDRAIILNHENRGEHKTVNRGLKLVHGKYFMYPNADDPLLPGAISTLVEVMEAHNEVLCAYPDWNAINEDGSVRHRVKVRDYDFEYMIKHHICLPSVGSMFRSSIINDIGYRTNSYRWISDFDYWIRIGLAGQMLHVPKTLAQWRHRDGQGSGDRSDKRAQEHIRIIQKFFKENSQQLLVDTFDMATEYYDIQKIARIKHEAICWSYLVAAGVTDSKVKAIGYFFSAIATYPKILVNIESWQTLFKRLYHMARK
jgi:glycosyltransferase involved in cell wall biosynthesis